MSIRQDVTSSFDIDCIINYSISAYINLPLKCTGKSSWTRGSTNVKTGLRPDLLE